MDIPFCKGTLINHSITINHHMKFIPNKPTFVNGTIACCRRRFKILSEGTIGLFSIYSREDFPNQYSTLPSNRTKQPPEYQTGRAFEDKTENCPADLLPFQRSLCKSDELCRNIVLMLCMRRCFVLSLT